MPTYQTITVDITPGAKEKPVLNASQFDNGRPFAVALTWEGVPFTDADDFDIEIHVKKPDGNIVTAEPDSVVNEVCSFLTTEQMCACHGINECEIVLLDNDIQIGTGNFILDVEKAPDEGGIQSASEIANLTQQIADIVPEVIGDDYYNKTQTDALLANKADISDLPDMTNYYDKSQVDTALAAKANTADLATVATSGDYDDLINKPTIPAAQIQSDYTQSDTTAVDYIKNKPDINAMIAAALLAVMPVETASGNPCTFDTDIAVPLKSLTAEITASGGNGTPATPIPIVGHSELNLVRCGINQWDEQWESGVYQAANGEIAPDANSWRSKDFIRVTSDTSYHFHKGGNQNIVVLYFYEDDGTYINYQWINANVSDDFNFTTPANCAYMHFSLYNAASGYGLTYNHDISVSYPNTATAYAPYNGDTFTVQFGQTVYGGVYDANRGKVRITHKFVTGLSTTSVGTSGGGVQYCDVTEVGLLRDADAKSNIYTHIMASDTGVDNSFKCYANSFTIYDNRFVDVATANSILANVEILYELVTPIEIDVSELSVDTIVGVNNIVSDCGGDVTASYKVSIQKYVDDQ